MTFFVTSENFTYFFMNIPSFMTFHDLKNKIPIFMTFSGLWLPYIQQVKVDKSPGYNILCLQIKESNKTCQFEMAKALTQLYVYPLVLDIDM